MNKILVTGNAGAGKSTISRQLGELLHLPVNGLDKILWKPRWQQTTSSQRAASLTNIIAQDQWIIDGVCSKAAKAADVVIFLDLPRYVCYWRMFWRNIPYLFKSRPDLPPKCPEIVKLPYVAKLVWQFPFKVRPNLLELLNSMRNNKTIIHIRNQKQLRQLLYLIGQEGEVSSDLRYKFA